MGSIQFRWSWLAVIVLAVLSLTPNGFIAQTIPEPPGSYSVSPAPTQSEKLFSFGPLYKDFRMPVTTMGQNFAVAPISADFVYFGAKYDVLYPNFRGGISLKSGVTNQADQALPMQGVPFLLIVPYWNHVGPWAQDGYYFRETTNSSDLERITNRIRAATASTGDFLASWAFIMTWYRSQGWGASSLMSGSPNTYQAVLTSDGLRSYVIFVYETLNWPVGTYSRPGYGMVQAGFDSGDGKTFTSLPGSGQSDIRERLRNESNVNEPGLWIYRVDGDTAVSSGCDEANRNLLLSPSYGTVLGGTKVSLIGPCIKNESLWANVTCIFGLEKVPATVRSSTEIFCISPFTFKSGKTPVRVSLDGGATFPFSADFKYELKSSGVKLEHRDKWYASEGLGLIEIEWNPSNFGNNSVDIQLLAWYTTPYMAGPEDYYNITDVDDSFSAMLFTAAVGLENTGGVILDPRTIVKPGNVVFLGGAFRIIRHAESANDADQLFSPNNTEAFWSDMVDLPFLLHGRVGKTASSQMYQPRVWPIVGWGATLATNSARYAAVRFAPTIITWFRTYRNTAKELGRKVKDVYIRTKNFWKTRYQQLSDRAARFCDAYGKLAGTVDYLTSSTDEFPIPPCPTNMMQAMRDSGRYQPDKSCSMHINDSANCLYNKGAHHCVVSTNPTFWRQGTAQQCCYSQSGRLLLARDHDVKGGGILQYAPLRNVFDENGLFFWLDHVTVDQMVSGICCVLDFKNSHEMCKKAVKPRLGDDGSSYVPPRPVITQGDPHVATFDGCRYTFNGLGEFTLIESTGQLTVQARAKTTKNGKATVWTAIALQGTRHHVVQVNHNKLAGTDVLVSGQPIQYENDQFTVEDVIVTKKSNGSVVEVVFSSTGAAIEIHSLVDMLDIVFYLPESFKGKTAGLMGSWNDNVTDDLIGLYDQVYQCSDSAQKLFEFGQNWRVGKVHSIFKYTKTETYDNINDLTYRPAFDPLNLSSSQAAEAKALCGNSTQCFFDFSITLDKNVAAAYLSMEQLFDQALNETAPVATCGYPEIDEVTVQKTTTNNTLLVGDIIQLQCRIGSDKISGNETIRCGEDKKWDRLPLACARKSCGKPETQNVVQDPAESTYMFGDMLFYQCQGSYGVLKGEKEIVCQADGQWSADALKCPATSVVASSLVVAILFLVRHVF